MAQRGIGIDLHEQFIGIEHSSWCKGRRDLIQLWEPGYRPEVTSSCETPKQRTRLADVSGGVLPASLSPRESGGSPAQNDRGAPIRGNAPIFLSEGVDDSLSMRDQHFRHRAV